jgi:hypothetical protein
MMICHGDTLCLTRHHKTNAIAGVVYQSNHPRAGQPVPGADVL